MNRKLEKKLKSLPSSPGLYFYKDKTGEIIYIGKAANLRNRVRQYFHQRLTAAWAASTASMAQRTM